MTQEFTLSPDTRGRLQLRLADGTHYDAVVPVRAFPLTAPDECVALVSAGGHEVVNIARLSELAEPARGLITETLAAREFVPKIEAIIDCSAFATPSTWTVRTDRGQTEFVLKAEEDIRRLDEGRLMITDSHGLQLEVVDQARLDAHSRRILLRFM
ncbi:MAG: DUF1854 domain-containing protein [Gammaproteobacteria bacterium]|nr:DUF1854 domain-containing protein [Gammaproteobacteria bacterium]